MKKAIRSFTTSFKAWAQYHAPDFDSMEGWDTFTEKYQKLAPVRYFLFNKLPRLYRVRVKMRVQSLIYAFKYRFIPFHQYHIVRTGLKPNYYDKDTIMLHANFSILKDYVEIELGWDYKKNKPRRQAGLEHLDWVLTHNDTLPATADVYEKINDDQINSAKEVKELYLWWEDSFKQRKDLWGTQPPYPVTAKGSTIHIFLEARKDPSWKAEYDLWSAQRFETEERWRKEEDEMLVRLVNVRRTLWT